MAEKHPTIEEVYQVLDALYLQNSSDASKFLEQLQESVYAWDIADQLLKQKKNDYSCYFGANTMKNKIKKHFSQIPPDSHGTLRDSLINNIINMPEATDNVLTQLSLALTNLAILIPTWNTIVDDFINKFGTDVKHIPFLLTLLTQLPEEIQFNQRLAVSSERRYDCKSYFVRDFDRIITLLTACLSEFQNNEKILNRLMICLSSWLTLPKIPVTEFMQSPLFLLPFNILAQATYSESVFETACDCISSEAYSVEYIPEHQTFGTELSKNVMLLRPVFHACKEVGDYSRAFSLTKTFMSYLDIFLPYVVQTPDTGYGDISSLDLLLDSINHGNLSIAEMTFDIWAMLAEILHSASPREIETYKPYFKQLIKSLWQLCQYNKNNDLKDLISDNDRDELVRFRKSSASLLFPDLISITGELTTFQEMYEILCRSNVTWWESESALFIMSSIVYHIKNSNSTSILSPILQNLLAMPDDCHALVKKSTIILFENLAHWINSNQTLLDPILTFLMRNLQNKNVMASAVSAIEAICKSCKDKVQLSHFQGLFQIAQSWEQLGLSNDSTISIIVALGHVLSKQTSENYILCLQNAVALQVNPLTKVLQITDGSPGVGTQQDPCFWLDRLSALFKASRFRSLQKGEMHPGADLAKELWPMFSQLLQKYQTSIRISERACRCLRFMLRCTESSCPDILPSMITVLVSLFHVNKHSCYLYVGSIIVDEYYSIPACNEILAQMFMAFIPLAFAIFSETDGLVNHPDTVDDFFRLTGRFLHRFSNIFFTVPNLSEIMQLSLEAIKLEHKDATVSILGFYKKIVKAAYPEGDEYSDVPSRQLLNEYGQLILEALIGGLAGAITRTLHRELTDCLREYFLSCPQLSHQWAGASLNKIPDHTESGQPVDPKAKETFFNSLTSYEDEDYFHHICDDFQSCYNY